MVNGESSNNDSHKRKGIFIVNLFIKVLRIVANIWIYAIGILIVICGIFILINQGFVVFRQTFSPFNIINWLVVLISFSPGIGALKLAERLEKRYKESDVKGDIR